MKIRLNEIPSEGREYIFSRETGELNQVLADVIGSHEYHVDVFIKPVGNVYEMSGSIKAMASELCSKCGWDLEVPIQTQVREFLLEESETHRKTHSVHGNHSVDFLDEGPSMVAIQGDVFDVGEYVHEALALGEALYPSCADESCPHLMEAKKVQRRLEQEFAQASEGTDGHPAFTVLRGLKAAKGGRKP